MLAKESGMENNKIQLYVFNISFELLITWNAAVYHSLFLLPF